MSKLRSVDVYPDGGHGAWLPDPAHDAFARSAQRVAALYTEALPDLELPIRVSHLRVFVQPGRWPRGPRNPNAEVELGWVERNDGFHMAFVQVPSEVAELTPAARGLLALDVIESAATQLAERVGWEAERLAAARQHVLDRQVEFTWTGPWKSSPDRKRKARIAGRIADDGYGRIWVEVTDGVTIRATDEAETGNSVGGFRDHTKLLRWDGNDALTFGPFGTGPIHPARVDRLEELIAHGPLVDSEGSSTSQVSTSPNCGPGPRIVRSPMTLRNAHRLRTTWPSTPPGAARPSCAT